MQLAARREAAGLSSSRVEIWVDMRLTDMTSRYHLALESSPIGLSFEQAFCRASVWYLPYLVYVFISKELASEELDRRRLDMDVLLLRTAL